MTSAFLPISPTPTSYLATFKMFHISMSLPAGSVGGRAQKRNNGLCQHFCLGEICPLTPSSYPDTTQLVPPFMSLVTFKLLPKFWSSDGVNPSKSELRPFKSNCLGLHQQSVSLSHKPHWSLQSEVMGTSLPGTGTLGLGVPGVGLVPLAPWGDFCSWGIPLDFYLPHMDVGPPVSCLWPSCQSPCGFFFVLLVAGFPPS